MIRSAADFPLMRQQTADLPERYVKHLKLKDSNELYNLYYFKEEIGQGAFGRVVEVTERSTNKVYACKIVQKSKVERWKELQNEIKILKFVNHPHIIFLDSIYETPKKIYMVIEKCEMTLEKVYKDRAPLSEKPIKIIIYDLAHAVNYLHTNSNKYTYLKEGGLIWNISEHNKPYHDIVHRDIKQENILMAKNEQDPKDENFIKLSDFGLSIIKTGRGLQNMMQDFCGTTGYMSPEILEQKAYSELCDVWAIGIIFYQLLFGQRPFRGANDIDIKEKIINDEPFYESDRIQVNGDAIHLLKAMLTKSPTNRITTALILDHPYLSKKLSKQSKTTLPDYNVLNTMSQWKDEMKVETTNRKSAQDWDNNLFQFQRFD